MEVVRGKGMNEKEEKGEEEKKKGKRKQLDT